MKTIDFPTFDPKGRNPKIISIPSLKKVIIPISKIPIGDVIIQIHNYNHSIQKNGLREIVEVPKGNPDSVYVQDFHQEKIEKISKDTEVIWFKDWE